MSASNGSRTLEERLAATIDPFKIELARLEEVRQQEIDAHRARMASYDTDISKISCVLKALGVETAATPQRSRKRATSSKPVIGPRRTNNGEHPTGFGVTAEKCIVWVDQIVALANPATTQKAVYKALDSDQSTASSVFKFLRDIEFIRKAGKAPKSEGGAELWAIQDRDALDRYFEQINEQEEQDLARLRTASLDSEDPVERVAAYIRGNSPVDGWVDIANALDMDDHRVSTIGRALAEIDLIKATGEKGEKKRIEWVGAQLAVAA